MLEVGKSGLRLALALALAITGPQAAFAQGKAKGQGAANQYKANTDNREGALNSYVNMDTDDPAAQMELLLQETYATQQRAIENQFILQYGDRIRMDNLNYNSGGELIPAHVFKPKVMVPGRRYPAVVLLHGGFHERFDQWNFPMVDAMVSKGYVVIFPEYRGSRGFGSAIYQNDYGVTDTADVIASGKYIASQPFVDPERVAIVGESRGGMLTLLSIQQAPKLFKAAVDIVGLTDFVAYMAYKPEYRRAEIANTNPSFKGQLPDRNLPAYMAVSPINFVDKIETPLLVMATTGDKIAPLSLHTGRLLDALKARGKVYESKIYENAPGGHTFMHGDTPEQADAKQRVFAWLEKYLGDPAK